jgi:hypothetical protein
MPITYDLQVRQDIRDADDRIASFRWDVQSAGLESRDLARALAPPDKAWRVMERDDGDGSYRQVDIADPIPVPPSRQPETAGAGRRRGPGP